MHEKHALRRAMDHFESLDLFGGVIRLQGKIVAFSLAVRLTTNTCDILFTKADRQIIGAYQIIYQEFLLHHPEFTHVNREIDLGITNIRYAKTSYHPDMMLKKYQVLIKRDHNRSDRRASC